jgi:delta8-fatty-acid desaturase
MAVSTSSATAAALPKKEHGKSGGHSHSYPMISRREIEALIADGRSIFILDQHAVKADAWLKYHPGGEKAIMHMVGRDATDEVNV